METLNTRISQFVGSGRLRDILRNKDVPEDMVDEIVMRCFNANATRS